MLLESCCLFEKSVETVPGSVFNTISNPPSLVGLVAKFPFSVDTILSKLDVPGISTLTVVSYQPTIDVLFPSLVSVTYCNFLGSESLVPFTTFSSDI